MAHRTALRSFCPVLVMTGVLFGCSSHASKGHLSDAGCAISGCDLWSDAALLSADSADVSPIDAARFDATVPVDSSLPREADAATAAMDVGQANTRDALADGAASIIGFFARPAWVAPGGSTMLIANYIHGATATVDQGIGEVMNGVPVSTGALSVTTRYRLTVRTPEGDTTTTSATVTVVEVTATSAMSIGRRFHTASLLPDGKVLIVGGANHDDGLASAELFDPATMTFAATGVMATPRTNHQAVSLADGRVLVLGGRASDSAGAASLATAEVYDPASGTFSSVRPMATARSYPAVRRLPDGRVLVTGGFATAQLASAEIFDPATGSFTATGAMGSARTGQTATLTAAGTVLVAAGYDGKENLATAEVFSPATGSFSAAIPLANGPRTGALAAFLRDGSILLAAGYNRAAPLSSSELWNPATGLFEAAAELAEARGAQASTSLADGRVFVSGGYGAQKAALSSVEIFDPSTGKFSASAPMLSARADHTVTLLADGRVFICAGQAGSAGLANSAEVHSFY